MNDRDTFSELRTKIDGSDPFMTGGHGIKKIRRQSRIAPQWTRDDKRVQELLLRAFPKLASEESQRRRASVWMRVIHLYYRMGMSDSQVAAEMETTTESIKNTLNRIRRVVSGRQANNVSVRAVRDPTHTS